MFIEDEELRNLYQTASEEHLQKLEAGLLQLEKSPDDLSPLEELLREAHSLKGDSRMLGVNTVEKLIHQIEHLLGGLQRQEVTLTPELSDRFYQGLDAVRKLVNEAVTGNPSGVDSFHTPAPLMGAAPPPAPPTHPNPAATEADHEVAPLPEPEPVAIQTPEIPSTPEPLLPLTPQPSPPTPPTTTTTVIPTATNGKTGTEPYRIETIRVATRHLDDLITQTGELTVTKIRIAHVASELESVLNTWGEWKTRHTGQNQSEQEQTLIERLDTLLQQLKLSSQENSTRLEMIAGNLEDRIRTLRLLPLSNIFSLFPRMVRDLAKQQGKDIELILEGSETTADKRILEEMKDPLMHIIRNAIDHGIESPSDRLAAGKPPTATIRLKGHQTTSNVIIEVSDDGRGLDLEKIKRKAIERGLHSANELAAMTPAQIYNLIFTPGFSTQTLITEVSGRGVGLDVVQTNVEHLKGSIQVQSTPGQGTTFRIQLGTTLATANVLLVDVGGLTQAIPVEYVETSLLIDPNDVFTVEGRETIAIQGQAISVAHLAQLLDIETLSAEANGNRSLPCILLRMGDERFGLFVDQVIDTQDVVLKPQSKLLKRVRNIAGATILGTGEVCMILNPMDLLKSIQRGRTAFVPRPDLTANDRKTTTKRATVLLAEDSITIRTQEKRILEGAGYTVITAVDGLDGFNKLKAGQFDAVISDVQMPNLDGLAMTRRIREYPEYNELPIILVTSLSSEDDRRRGAEAGANAYITKGTFDQSVLLETLERLV
ncbi:hybrid sensor histidine kinase/response regulator [Spirulina sp. CCNP1310]|uniref:hybrid sensor histidine kinase/response regulator n=1 Tax=Spirulina sp. CCNP1310 TaxID=3110249 RepID=UPI002B1F6DBD|nr:hybrid sensor histidine kinase/response regulator [Spirulina sp. CCNP1310]MEA5417969.1 hybrid sensor histidine kinase/response regulator [Spirulina sp. CCNP1310]